MPRTIDWYYRRKACATCQKAQLYLDEQATPITETVDAAKIRIAPAGLIEVLKGIETVVASRGKSIVTLDLRKGVTDEATLHAHLIGPTGNLRAPAARVGKTLLVGFHPDAYAKVLG